LPRGLPYVGDFLDKALGKTGLEFWRKPVGVV
jgi:hypothetical protein